MDNYTLIKNEVLRGKLKSTSKIVFLIIISFYNKECEYAKITYKELMELTGISNKTLLKALKELKELNYITIETNGNCNVYKINKGLLI